jgi:hypothetical protein
LTIPSLNDTIFIFAPAYSTTIYRRNNMTDSQFFGFLEMIIQIVKRSDSIDDAVAALETIKIASEGDFRDMDE